MKTTLTLSGLLLTAVGTLIYLAGWRDNVVAAFTLGLLTAALLIGAGFGISLLQAHIAAKREELRFSQNVKENLAIMAKMQSIQNAQNAQLLKQVRQLPDRVAPALTIDDAIFTELED